MIRCFYCFNFFDQKYDVCPHCGNVILKKPKEPIHLVPGTLLADRYIIGAYEGAGGFGIVYRAWDIKLEVVVAVKEFYVSRFMTRAEGSQQVIINKKNQTEYVYRKERFLAEARTLARFGAHRSIPNVYEYFEANNTAYIVMELLDGLALNQYLEKNGHVSLEFAMYVADEVGNALISLHKEGIIHRDVAPDNIFICTGGEIRIKLMDVGAAKLMDSTDNVIDTILKPGYSPYEQYLATGKISPATDEYALGATLYMLLSGIKPPEATNRKRSQDETGIDPLVPLSQLNPEVPEHISAAIMRALAIESQWRFKSVSDFMEALTGFHKVRTVEQEKKHRRRRRISGIVLAVAIIAVVSMIVLHFMNKEIAEEGLDRAVISVWVVDDGMSSKVKAMEEIAEDFHEKFGDVRVEIEAIPAEQYQQRLQAAANANELPNLFESTEVPDSILEGAIDLKNVLKSSQAKECLFINQYDKYYSDRKRMPLAIEVPVAYVITNGPIFVSYDDNTFTSVRAFPEELIAFDERYSGLLRMNYEVSSTKQSSSFLNLTEDNVETGSAVLLSSTMAINDIRDMKYQYKVVYYDSDEIGCRFVFEWSIGKGNKAEDRAAERLLAWMMGNVYQQKLMLNSGSGKRIPEIPINKSSFLEKAEEINYLNPVLDIYTKFVFQEEK